MTHARHGASSGGFSLVELLIALGLSVAITSAVFGMLADANGAFQAQPERHDVEQRLRAGSDALVRDLLASGRTGGGVGPYEGRRQAPVVYPYRLGRRSPDAPGVVDPTKLTVWSVSASGPQATAATALPVGSGSVTLSPGPLCPPADAACGFRAGTTMLALAAGGVWDVYTVSAVTGSVLTLQHNLRDTASVYPAGTWLAEAVVRTYFLKTDRVSAVPQLVRYDAGAGADVPVVDHVAGLRFELFGDGEPPAMTTSGWPLRARPSYGPTPPEVAVVAGAYPAGENCTFVRDADGALQSRLASLGSATSLVAVDASLLTDGPWCPDSVSPNRWDADLLRVRQVKVTLTVEAAVAALRGPAGPLFTRGGTARGNRFVPDRTAEFVVAPRAVGGGS